HFVFRYRSPEDWLRVFRAYYGPMLKAFEAVGAAGERSLSQDLLSLVARSNRAIDGTMVVPSAYLEAVILPRGSQSSYFRCYAGRFRPGCRARECSPHGRRRVDAQRTLVILREAKRSRRIHCATWRTKPWTLRLRAG